MQKNEQDLVNFLRANLRCPYFVEKGVIEAFLNILLAPEYDFSFCFSCFQKLIHDSATGRRTKQDIERQGGFYVKMPISPYGSKKIILPSTLCLYLFFYKNTQSQLVFYRFNMN